MQMCAVPSHPMGRFPWDSHRNDIHMDKPADLWIFKNVFIKQKNSLPDQRERIVREAKSCHNIGTELNIQ